MNEITKFLKDCKTFYLATVDCDKPQVRPFGAVCKFGGKLYIGTNNKKNVYQQMKANPNVSICGLNGGKWIRINGQVHEDMRREARVAMMEDYRALLSKWYTVDDNLMTVFAFDKAEATIYSFTGEPEKYTL